MAVIIRMKRTGRRHHPCYRISVADSRKPRDGRTIENLGVYDPLSPLENLRVTLNVERAKHWLSMGALPSRTVRSVFQAQGIFEAATAPAKRDRSGRKKKTATGTRKRQAKAAGLVAKEARRNQRIADKAAAKAAAAATSEE